MKAVAQKRLYYEAGWTDSWSHRRCFHQHKTIQAAAECVQPYGAYGYVFAVEDGKERELRASEELAYRAIRFGKTPNRNQLRKSGTAAEQFVVDGTRVRNRTQEDSRTV